MTIVGKVFDSNSFNSSMNLLSVSTFLFSIFTGVGQAENINSARIQLGQLFLVYIIIFILLTNLHNSNFFKVIIFNKFRYFCCFNRFIFTINNFL
ncbi:hypothetical protein [Bacillus phage vB_BthP-HD73phi]|nr:hypothetical protein [Bacillus phage vB_BthP-HD73phi]